VEFFVEKKTEAERQGRLGGVEDLICLEVRGQEWCCGG
jgi:hypothetical protein